MKEIGQYFKDRFEQFEPNPPSDFWSKIQNDKALKRFNKMQSFKRYLKFGFTPAAVIAVAVLVWVASTQKENTQNQVNQNTPETTTLVSKSESQPVQTLKTKTEEVNIVVTSTKKINENNAESKVDPIIEPAKTTIEPTHSPIQNRTTSVLNKGVPSSSSNTIPVVSSPKENPKTNTNNKSSFTSKTDPVEKSTTTNDEKISDEIFDKNNSEPEEGIDELMIPNSFTPNGDGRNDQFFVKAMWDVDDFELFIFERGGNLIFKSKNIEEGWDGTYQGQEIHAGVYAYFIVYKDSKGNKVKTKGTLNLIR